MHNVLDAEFTREEVKAALDHIGDLKAPGPDGMPSIVFKRHWQFMGDRVVEEVLAVLNGGDIPEGWNDTCVVLIPKVKNPNRIKDLRPISLCNVLYKLVSKVMANRLKVVLPGIISENQSAFVPGRLITDNVLIAYELSHYLLNKRHGKEGVAAVKADMSKAYDRVEWDFLEAMLRKLGFRRRWVDLIMKCVSTVRYQIKVNRTLTTQFCPSRGLRQGDPLSPYLFVICAEGLSASLHDAAEKGSISGVKICPGAPSISHPFFANDSVLLIKANQQEAAALHEALKLYEESSGQCINVEKSAVMFSPNTSQLAKDAVKQAIEIHSENWNDRYLGLPVHVGRSRRKAFAYIKGNICGRVYGWQERLLAKESKEALVKTVAQAIPTHAMSCFDLTKTFCSEVNTLLGRFRWSQQDKQNTLH
uniref:Reverse transcriptase domain-containing protein n=1 Tax=Aegilops tauschii subsp. strangulata TaxID=200361 RepID=A0A452ZV79_AEGTS